MKFDITSLSIIKSIRASFSPYKGSSIFHKTGMILIEIKENNVDQRPQLITLLNNNTNGFEFNTTIDFNGPYMLVSYDIEYLRNIIDHIYKNNLISNTDRSNIETELRAIEKDVFLSKNVSSKMTEAQKDIIKFMCDEHIDMLIRSLKSPKDIDKIVNALNIYPLPGLEKFKKWLIEEDKHTGEQLSEIMESYEYVGKVYQGRAGLEDTFVKQGSAIPTLEMQKEIIKSFLESKVQEVFYVKNLGL